MTHATEDQHRANDDIGQEPEEQEHQMRARSPSLANDLEECVSVGCLHLQVAGEDSEEEDLDCRSGCVGVGTGYAESETHR